MSKLHTAPVGEVVFPGQSVCKLPDSGQLRVGPGLEAHNNALCTTKSGILRKTKVGKLWVEGRQKRYIPAVEESVIGVITEKYGENFAVDIGGPFTASLPVLAFEGATRRNRPNLQVGDIVYARVTSADRDLDPVLACVDAQGKASGFGQLKEGYLITSNTHYARRLLSRPPCPVLASLEKHLKQFEVAVGMNGKIWIDSPSTARTVIACNAIQRAEFMSSAQTELLVSKLVDVAKS
ncbi:hypothetical protein ABBQ32_007940 [Trebouxia sp. C0010 RCD-2024]